MKAAPLWSIFSQQPSMPGAACHQAVKEGVDPSLWDGKREEDTRTRRERESDIRHAKSICNICPEKLACLEYAMREGVFTGIWGGQTEDERAELSKRAIADPNPRLCELDKHVLPPGVERCHRCANAQSNARYRQQVRLRTLDGQPEEPKLGPRCERCTRSKHKCAHRQPELDLTETGN